jgi:S-disulfanyl-L-cysteine oxidoreductase SoxD
MRESAATCTATMFLLFGSITCPLRTAFAQPEPASASTIWDGVYTADQAERGRSAYEDKCASCHGANLSAYGGVLTDRFLAHWREDTVDNYFKAIKSTMPRGAPASLTDSTYVDIVSFILKTNGSPAGTEELNAAALSRIRIEGKSGPQPLTSGALVQVVGCLEPRGGKEWALTQASSAVRTRNPKDFTAEELSSQDAQPLGVLTYGLMDTASYRPESQNGQKVAARGFLIAKPGDHRINLTALRMTGSACQP